jgi:uncharacterized protein
MKVIGTSRRSPASFPTLLEAALVSLVLAGGSLTIAAAPTGQGSTAQVQPETTQSNSRLAGQKSPYLQEHARDLVHWYPWGPAAFAQAQKENKLIFLSIGYSSCHWCHVMQKENFQNPRVGGLMNQDFVSILVDREERPDIDDQYLAVCEMLTGSGGWPLNIIMTPDRKPLFASTYIPTESVAGRPGMLELIPEIERKWKRHPAQLSQGGEKVAELLQTALDRDAPGRPLDQAALDKAYRELAASFDTRYGGFGTAPKFPPALDLFFLLRYWRKTRDAKGLAMVEKTLDAMRAGAIFDQIGFGFHRYATDEEWDVPHFEKMLYDQALLALAYTEAYQATREARFAATAREIFTYVLRDLTAPQGAFYDAQDADSQGVEGAYYLWTEKQLRAALSGPEFELVTNVFDVRPSGNIPGGSENENILHLRAPLRQIAGEMKISPQELRRRLEAARVKLFAARERRPAPRKDRKVLAAWNGLMIAALAKGAQATGDEQYAAAAARAADFILRNMRSPDGRLLHVYEGGTAAVPANLNDYAFLTWGLIELYEADFRPPYLQDALQLSDQLMRHFWDAKNGAFFFTADDDRTRLVREKNMDDIDLPSGNSIAALDLLRLADMTGNVSLAKKADQVERAFSGAIRKSPSDYPAALVAAEYAIGPSYEVVVAGDSNAPDTKAMIQAATKPFLPDKVVLLRPTGDGASGIVRLADYTRYESGINGKPTAYVCMKYNCKLPTNDPAKMLQLLGAESVAPAAKR